MRVVAVEDVAGLQLREVGDGIAELREFARGEAAREFPAARDVAAAIDADGVRADGVIEEAAFFRAVSIARKPTRTQAAIEFLRRVKAAPFVGKADVPLPGDPPAAVVAFGLKLCIGRIDADAIGIGAVKRVRASAQ